MKARFVRSTLLARCGLLVAAVLLLWLAPVARGTQMSLDEPVTISLEQAALVDVLGAFARILGARLELEPSAVETTVSAQFEYLPLRNALDSICRSAGCRAELLAGSPPILRVRRLLDLDLERADYRQVLSALARIRGLELDAPPEGGGELTLALEGVTWEEAMASVCRAPHCRFREADGRLVVRLADPEGRLIGDVRLRGEPGFEIASELSPSRRPERVAVRLRFGRADVAEVVDGKIELGWSQRWFMLRPPPRVPWEVRLSWIPLGSVGRGAVVPFLIHCGEPHAVVHALEPVALPLADSVRFEIQEVVLELLPLGGPAAGEREIQEQRLRREGAPLVGDHLRESCLDVEPVTIVVRLTSGGDGSVSEAATFGYVGASFQIVWPAAGGQPKGSERDLAVVLLGLDPSLNPKLGLLVPDEEGSLTLLEGEGLPDLPWTERVTLAGQTIDVEIEVAPDQ